MSIALIMGRDEEDRTRFTFFLKNIPTLIKTLDPTLKVEIYPEIDDFRQVEFAITWKPPFGIFAKFPNLKCIASFAAGVDHLFADPELPLTIPIVRITDPAMSNDITHYVMAAVLYWMKRFDAWEKNQAQQIWGRSPPFNFSDQPVGIMGLGFLGRHAAETLASLKMKVLGWSLTDKKIPGVTTFSGANQLENFLSQTHALVCMLPLTSQTRHILNAKTFSYLPKGAYLINLGRGEHLVEADLLAALASHQISGACLDVFEEEPLPASHPFWRHPNIRVTPHIASVTNAETAIPQILENYYRVMNGRELVNQVDPNKGY